MLGLGFPFRAKAGAVPASVRLKPSRGHRTTA